MMRTINLYNDYQKLEEGVLLPVIKAFDCIKFLKHEMQHYRL